MQVVGTVDIKAHLINALKKDRVMSDIKLFRARADNVSEVFGTSIALERSLQALIENNLETFLGVTFLASEYSTGKDHGGRMDTLGIDENGCPVIIEYKRSSNENVINQGLFYLDWLMDHKKDFEWLVLEKLGQNVAANVEWAAPRLLCIAGDFTKYDGHAVKQINRNIDLIRYRRYGEELLLLQLVNAVTSTGNSLATQNDDDTLAKRKKQSTVSEYLEKADSELTDLYEAVKGFALALGDDVQLKILKNYFAFRRIKNFACVEIHNLKQKLLVYVKVDPDTVDLTGDEGFLRDVRKIGHFGTGDLEITISSMADFEIAKPLLERSYEAS